jgi:hypothetical protein
MKLRILGLKIGNDGFYNFTMAAPVPIKKSGIERRVRSSGRV